MKKNSIKLDDNTSDNEKKKTHDFSFLFDFPTLSFYFRFTFGSIFVSSVVLNYWRKKITMTSCSHLIFRLTRNYFLRNIADKGGWWHAITGQAITFILVWILKMFKREDIKRKAMNFKQTWELNVDEKCLS